MNLNEQTVEQLKALGYDQMAILEQTQANLRAIQQELSKRAQSKPDTKTSK